MAKWILGFALIFPGRDMTETIIIAFGFAVGGLPFLTEMTTTGFGALQGIAAHEFPEFNKVRYAAGMFEGLIEGLPFAGDADIGPETFLEILN